MKPFLTDPYKLRRQGVIKVIAGVILVIIGVTLITIGVALADENPPTTIVVTDCFDNNGDPCPTSTTVTTMPACFNVYGDPCPDPDWVFDPVESGDEVYSQFNTSASATPASAVNVTPRFTG